jgi:hypothetical protein
VAGAIEAWKEQKLACVEDYDHDDENCSLPKVSRLDVTADGRCWGQIHSESA